MSSNYRLFEKYYFSWNQTSS